MSKNRNDSGIDLMKNDVETSPFGSKTGSKIMAESTEEVPNTDKEGTI
jgi:hypothetical protein